MNTTVDGEFQRYAVETGAYIREHFFGPDPRLRQMVEHLTDDELRNLPRGGHDYRKLYAAYKAATEQRRARPTVILAKTIKGWTLGPDVEGRNATHQIKKMTKDQLRRAPRPAVPPRRDPRRGARRRRAAVLPPGRGLDRVPVHDGAPPGARRLAARSARRAHAAPLELPDRQAVRRAARRAPASRRCRPRWASPACCATWPATSSSARGSCRSSPTRPARSAWTRCSGARDLRRRRARCTSRSTTTCCCRTTRRPDGQILEEGITEAGSMASFIAAGTELRHPRRADGAVLHLLFDVRLPAGRRPHLAGRRRPGPRLPARRHRRPHHAARRGPAAPGRPQPRAGLDGAGRARPTTRRSPTRSRRSSRTGCSGCTAAAARTDVFYYLTLYNENYVDAGRCPTDVDATASSRGLYRWARRARRARRTRATILFSGIGAAGRPRGRGRARRALRRRRRAVVGDVVQAAARGGARGRALEPPAPRPSRPARRRSPSCSPTRRARSSPSPTS